MFILLPFAHEKQTVQRLPYVTFALIALNVVFFLFTHYGGSSLDDLYEKLDALQQYVASHPYLEIPPEGRKYFEDWQLQQLDALREATNKQDLDPEQVKEDQETLNSLIRDVKRVEKSNPYERYGYIPAEPSFIGLFTCMFIHGGWLHLIGNMFFLYLAGCNIEDLWGRPLYTAFYLLSGIAATMAHALKYPADTSPLVGASGAIAGLMGAFLVRLYDTKISFFYAIWFWVRGTFKAPAYVMLPLWLAQQFFYAMLDEDGSYGVAFWAHIGGFVFGALFAFGMKKFQIEERFIAPKIEKKVGLAQHPDFLRAMNLSEEGNYPDALILLHRVVRDDPNHLEAYLEMRRIAEINKDASSYMKFSVAIFDILLRTRDWDLLLDLYHQYQNSPLRQPLPAKSLLGLGTFFEETLDFRSASQHYEEVTANYPQDPISLRAYSKLARLYFEKMIDRDKAIENFWRSYHHPHADSQWRAALQMDIKRYQIPEMPASAFPVKAAAVIPVPPPLPFKVAAETVPESAPEAVLPVDDSTQAIVVPPPVIPPRPAARLGSADRVLLPDGGFDGAISNGWHIVQCRLDRLALKGLDIRNEQQTTGLLPWKKIRTVSVGRVRVSDPSIPGPQQAFLVVDLIVNSTIYRLKSDDISFDKLFPGVDQSFEEAFQNFMGIVIKNSAARCIPNHDSCLGPNFATYPDLARYESRLKEKLTL
ncbi:rhomboid family intramembrane serine protease [bacterium]|nr:rhomboid family intramembrane serine protease [bacterium]MCI0601837.1 rhomboid family intramembrane serine protease [bacterium]